jgi:hypothetical protein
MGTKRHCQILCTEKSSVTVLQQNLNRYFILITDLK